ncbi:hypothetical protein AMTR_s00031p00215140 [Amborella trichopoda]|uniref:Uncharacterized protein n=1 Tax=Amborella trichopoda TaxID=13333 RepID=U5D599_AMBTC|nr:hypothetical protein AMTR_s00031p00215140 [Amborella trichopoda]
MEHSQGKALMSPQQALEDYQILKYFSHSMRGSPEAGAIPISTSCPGPPFSSYNMIKKPSGSVNAANAIFISVRSRDFHQEENNLVDVTEVTGYVSMYLPTWQARTDMSDVSTK